MNDIKVHWMSKLSFLDILRPHGTAHGNQTDGQVVLQEKKSLNAQMIKTQPVLWG